MGQTYRNYRIEYAPPPIPVRTCDWQFWHVDYDGPEDRRSGSAPTLEAAKEEINAIEADLHPRAQDGLDAAWDAVNACGGSYSQAEHANGYAAAHAAALDAALEAIKQLGALR